MQSLKPLKELTEADVEQLVAETLQILAQKTKPQDVRICEIPKH